MRLGQDSDRSSYILGNMLTESLIRVDMNVQLLTDPYRIREVV